MGRMTLADIRTMNTDFITADIAGKVMGLDPQSIRVQAQRDTKKLGFPVVVVGSRVMIPRIPFLRFIESGC